jgi:hypothetical protein
MGQSLTYFGYQEVAIAPPLGRKNIFFTKNGKPINGKWIYGFHKQYQ